LYPAQQTTQQSEQQPANQVVISAEVEQSGGVWTYV